jgi:predicted nucleotidyltransferase
VSAASILLEQVAKLLDRHHVAYALVGGWAVSVRTEPRFTRDIDLAVAVGSDHDAEQLIAVLIHEGFKVENIVEQTAVSRLATVRLRTPSDVTTGLLLDILFASSGIEPEICATAERLEVFAGVWVPVARMEHLLAIKILARDDQSRPQDRLDISMLLRAMDEHQVSMARDLLDLIIVRGFHREKELQSELNMFMQK